MVANEGLGGLIITRPPKREYSNSDRFGFTLMSDLHIGARDVDYSQIKRDLASYPDDRIAINGDVFDAILPSDRKRFQPDVLHSRLQGRKDVLNAAIDLAVDILGPHADRIDMIGCGNHDTAVETHHHLDPIILLIDRLQAYCPDGHEIAYGGYCGFLAYRWQYVNAGGAVKNLTIFYHHGSGGSSPVTKGMIDFNRFSTWVDSDVIWMGHKHNRITGHVRRLRCPTEGDTPRLDDVRHIMTGSYYDTYTGGQSQADIRRDGKRASWASERAFAPQGKGGARLVATLTKAGVALEVTQ